MKLTDILFWGILAAITIFYIQKGNTMHEEKFEVMKVKQMEQNSTK